MIPEYWKLYEQTNEQHTKNLQCNNMHICFGFAKARLFINLDHHPLQKKIWLITNLFWYPKINQLRKFVAKHTFVMNFFCWSFVADGAWLNGNKSRKLRFVSKYGVFCQETCVVANPIELGMKIFVTKLKFFSWLKGHVVTKWVSKCWLFVALVTKSLS